MNNSRRRLKEASFLVLLFTAFTLIRLAVRFFVVVFDVDPSQVNASRELILIATIILFVINLICLIPQTYVGIRGIKIAENPTSTKGHIVWAVILLAFAVFSIIHTSIGIAESEKLTDSIFVLADHSLDVIVYCMYIKYANQVLNRA